MLIEKPMIGFSSIIPWSPTVLFEMLNFVNLGQAPGIVNETPNAIAPSAPTPQPG